MGDNVKQGSTKYYMTSLDQNSKSSDTIFYSSDMFSLQEGYSNFISANQAFIDPPVVKVTVDNAFMKEYSVTAQI